MNSSSHPFFQTVAPSNDALLLTLFIAAVIHAFILLGISFSMPSPPKVNRQIEVTLSSTPTKKAPKKANFLAQDNQQGSGDFMQKPAPQKQVLASQGNSLNKPPSLRENQPKSRPKARQKLITQQQALQKITATKKESPPSEKVRPKFTAESLQQQIAQLGADIRHSQQQPSEKTKIKIKFINSVSTHKYVAAQYVKDWEQKIEKVGNLNYPRAAGRKRLSGSLTTDVGINPNGSIYSIRIAKSSGNQLLDDAAKRIIRLSAPFAPIPKEILQQLDVLVITRVWRFSDETGITTR